MENDMSKKNQTKKGKEKQIPERELLYDKYYLIDEKKCLYGELNGDGIYYRIKGGKAFVRQKARSADDNSAWAGPPIAFTRSK